jgi:hypothetical protein
MVQGVYKFQFTVTDNIGAVGRDTIQVTVNAAGNVPPTANAGTDQSIIMPVSTVSLAGTGTDTDGTIASYSWTKISGPTSSTITSANSASTTVSALVQGVYKFELKVTDNIGAVGRDTIQVTVNAAVNIVPTVNAGADQTITLPASTVSLAGTGTDTDGTIASYSWTKISGPTSGTITSTTSASTTVTALVQGVYQFQLTVTDNSGATANDVMQVTVNAASATNTPYTGIPKPIPGTIQVEDFDNGGQNIAYYDLTTENSGGFYRTTESVDLQSSTEGNANIGWTDPGEWTKYTVNVLSTGIYTLQARLSSQNAVSSFRVEMDGTTIATITAPNTGGYQVWQTVSVTGISLSAGIKVMRIYFITGGFNINFLTFTSASNLLPTANAGTDQTITLPTNTVTLTGSGTDADGTIASYAWSKVSGPASGTITSSTTASTTVTGLVQGVYKFELKVTDNSGGIGRDTIQVSVNAANQSPTANAGIDQTITLPTNTVSLTGSGTDADGTIASYAWSKVSGPASGTITSATTASTTVIALAQGVYKFELKVTDNSGGIGRDTIQVTVNAANQSPTSNAGTDQTITLPTNTVTLTGTGTDADGTIASYLWTKVSGPASGTITSATTTSTMVTALAQGIYKFELKVTDNSGGIGRDTMQVTVNAANQPPIANAGTDQTIMLPASTVTLTGTGTDADGTIISYLWTKVSGPASGTITSATTASTTVTALVQGVYKFELKVTDNNALTGRDTILVTVNALTNTPYTGTPKPIPGTIEVEDFDNGGQNIAYYDVTPENSGGDYRPAESVDLRTATEGTAFLGWTNDNEWTKYTVNVTSSGIYTLTARVSTFSTVSSFHIEMDGITIATIPVPNTAGYQTWQNVTVTGIPLTAGIKVMRFYIDVAGFNITRFIFTQTSTSRTNPLITGAGSNQNIVSAELPAAIAGIYPNPVSTSVKIQLNNAIPGNYQFSMTDIFGKKVWMKTINNNASSFSESINTAAMLNGMYILEIISPGDKRKTYKVIKN